MQIAVITNNNAAPIFNNVSPTHTICYVSSLDTLQESYDIIFDYNYINTPARNAMLTNKAKYVFINYVGEPLTQDLSSFIKFNGWNTLCQNPPIEVSYYNESEHNLTILNELPLPYIVVPNNIGMLTPKVVSMIVNEAYFALEENVSTKAAIDVAMKLGTSYPHGPFEWAALIGLNNIATLLLSLSKQDARYNIAPLLLTEAKIN
jgi:3-hydroxybutyryl-CoA dehydrogenase